MTELRRKVLGIDFGSKRIGVAITDALFIAAHPLEMVPVDKNDLAAAARRIGELAREHDAELAVVGLPLNMDDTDSEQTKATRAFAVLLQETTGLRVDLEDERLTSVSAEEIVRQSTGSGWRKQRKARKAGKVDVIAAQILLQSWMERRLREEAAAARDADEDEDDEDDHGESHDG